MIQVLIFKLIFVLHQKYFFFIYYKELKYQFIIERPEQKHLEEEKYDDSEKEKFILGDKKLCNIIDENSDANEQIFFNLKLGILFINLLFHF